MSPKGIADKVIEGRERSGTTTITLPSAPAVLDLKPSEQEIMAPPSKPFMPESKAAQRTLKVAEAAPGSPH